MKSYFKNILNYNKWSFKNLFLNSLNLRLNILCTVAALFGPIYFFVSKEATQTTLALSVSLLMLCLLVTKFFWRSNKGYFVVTILQTITLEMTSLSFFLAVGPMVTANDLQTFDSVFLAIDDFLLGWMFPKGQLALYIDRTSIPDRTVEKFIIEFFQLCYTSYFIWSSLILAIFVIQYLIAYRRKHETTELRLTILKMYLCALFTAYYLTFLGNSLFPGKSPRIYLEEEYQHPLEGLGLSEFLRGLSTDDSSFGTFPSGHVSESFIAAFFSVKFLHNFFGFFIVVMAISIAMSTMYLRYHYFIDVVVAFLVVTVALLYSSYLNFSGSLMDFITSNVKKEKKASEKREKLFPASQKSTKIMIPLIPI